MNLHADRPAKPAEPPVFTCDWDDGLFEHPTPPAAPAADDIWALLADVRFVFWMCDQHPDNERHLVDWDRDPVLGLRPRCLTCGNEGVWR